VPDWFIRLDADGDGQVGLYEWKTSGRPLEEFSRMDRNGDGFVTVPELLFFLAQQAKNRSEGTPHADAPTVKVKGKR
jgi:hypothetical protein